MIFTIDKTTHISPNHSARTNPKPSAIVLHTGEGTRTSDLIWLKKQQGAKSVSSHYYVCRDGTIYQLVDDSREAWHAGPGVYLGLSDWNDFSIGIETEHKKGQDWPAVQKQALAWLCQTLIARYGIDRSMIIAHRWLKRPPTATKKYDPTNWPDPELAAWIAALYAVPDYAALWGTHFPFFEASGIAAAWRPHATVLREAVSDETRDKAGRVWRLFAGGGISFSPQTGETAVYLPRAKP